MVIFIVSLTKIDSGNLGVINLNNMIPVKNCYIFKIYPYKTTKQNDAKYNELLNNQLSWINKKENKEKIIKKATNLRNSYINNELPENIKNRCVDFIKLEKYVSSKK